MKRKLTILILIFLVGINSNLISGGEQLPQKSIPPKEIPQREQAPRPQVQKKPEPYIPGIKRNPTKKVEEPKTQEVIKEAKDITLFPDDYSELDDYTNLDTKDNEVILRTLEQARQKYIQALILLEKADSTNASNYFEKSIEILNRIAIYPGIEKNKNFIDLAQSVIDDYEKIVKSIESLDDDSPFFLIRNKLYTEVDTYQPTPQPLLTTIVVPKDTSSSIVGSKPVVTNPKPTVIPLDENDEVLKNIAFLTAEGKKGGKRFYQKWLERSGRWFPMMRQIAAEEGAPEELIYLSMIESGLKPTAISSAKAVGLWQFMRSTGEMYGLNATPSVWVDERRDPEKSTRAAMKHLKDLYAKFGDWHLALAAYNAGAGRVGRTLEKHGSDSANYWEIRDKLPPETSHYVPIYIATTKIALNPEAYGFKVDSLKFDNEYEYDTYTLNEPISLSVIAKCLDTTREAISDLNPELLRSITPPDFENYNLKIPKNKSKVFAARFSSLTPEEKQPWVEHQVKRGETISQIARDYGISRNEIALANDLASYRSRLVNGSTIKIPLDKEFLAEKKKVEEERQQNIAVTEKVIKEKNAVSHSVKTGETLYSIANKYGLRMTDLRNLNNLPFDDDNISVGQKLIISVNPDKKDESKIEVAKNEESNGTKLTRHKVKTGETLHSIAENYNIAISDIKSTNNLNSDNIAVGQMLVIESTRHAGNLATNISVTPTTEHKVKKGETLSMIAGTYGVTEDDLKKWNPKTIVGNKVYYGTSLKVVEATTSKGSAEAAPKDVNVAPKYYKVQPGDTMSSISRKFGVSLENLKARNKKVNPDNLMIGQKIRIQ